MQTELPTVKTRYIVTDIDEHFTCLETEQELLDYIDREFCYIQNIFKVRCDNNYKPDEPVFLILDNSAYCYGYGMTYGNYKDNIDDDDDDDDWLNCANDAIICALETVSRISMKQGKVTIFEIRNSEWEQIEP